MDEPETMRSADRPAHRVKPKHERIPVTVVRRSGQAALVEFADAGKPARVTLPEDLLEGDGAGCTADPAELAAGVPFGLPWEKATTGRVTPEKIAVALRNAGIWTAEDLKRQPRAAVGALQAAYGLDLAALMAFAAESGKETSHA
jgi:hypothetical protein